MSLLYWNCIIIVQILMEIISCQNIGIHELSHDYNLKKIDVQHVQKLPSFLDTSITYQYRYEPLPNTTVRYFLAKPWRLRYVEFHDRIHDVRILHRQAQIRFDRVRRTHEGIYSLYQFYFQQTSSHADHDYDDDDDLKQNSPSNHARLVHYTRRDFNLVVHGLKKEREFCRDNAECESGSCPSFYCVCNRQTPVWLEMAKICLETKNINDTCHDHIECQWNGGPEAECFKHQWSRCRCRKPSVAIKISSTQYHCVHMAELGQPCIFSKQCTLSGENRYCNGSYRCDCLPGYYHRSNNHRCISSSSSSSPIQHINRLPIFILSSFLTIIVCYDKINFSL
ncbi:uncharacterized protein LOC124498597 [Dermatophagoides farinae]|uniref:uncharacterized protein LOC124498597 n=1 Tax=Dermatophagoides farinae TaxID=6954 RepID=UPI003F639097